MAKNSNKKNLTDVEECRNKVKALLEEYNCRIVSCDDWSGVYMYDADNYDERASDINPKR